MESSSDHELPPARFTSDTTLSQNYLQLPLQTQHNVFYCSLCQNRHKHFYCQRCVRNGDFVHSNPRLPELLSEKQLKLLAMQRENSRTRARIVNVIDNRLRANRMNEDIKTRKHKIKLLKSMVNEKQESLKRKNENAKRLKSVNEKREQRLPQFADKVSKISQCCEQHRNDLIQEAKKLSMCERGLSYARKRHVSDLEEFIFGLTKDVVDPVDVAVLDDDTELISSIAEAMATSYVHGQWVTNDPTEETCYKIVAPKLPGSGDYSAYHAWILATKDNPHTSHDHDISNPAHNISAGLTFLAQFLAQLSYCLDVILPRRVGWYEFGQLISNEYRFAKKVANLNQNTVHLCLNQGVRPELIRPKQTLYNLLTLLQRDHLGRLANAEIGKSKPNRWMEEMAAMGAKILEDSDKLRHTADGDSDSDEDEVRGMDFDEWEAVDSDSVDMMAMIGFTPPSGASPPSPPPSTLTSTATSFMSSFLKGFGGGSPKK